MTDLDKLILGYCITDKTCLGRCASEIEPKFFETDEAQTIFKLTIKYHSSSGCCLTERVLDDLLDEEGVEIDHQEDCRYMFSEVIENDIDVNEFDHDLKQFKHEFTSRWWAEFTETFTGDPKIDYQRFKKEALPIFETGGDANITRGTVATSLDELFDEYKEIEANPEKAYGIRTGFSIIDEETLGMHPGECWLISGRTGAGKSVFLLNVAVNAYRAGKNVMIFSLEMPFDQYLKRFIASYCGLSYKKLRGGQLNKEEKRLFEEAIEEIKTNRADDGHDLHMVDIPQANAFTIQSEINRVISQHDYMPDVIVVDYLGIMRSVRQGQADWQEQGYACEELRKLARELNIPTITASQLNRDKQKSKGTERISRSDIIGHTVDIFLQIEEKSKEEEQLSLADDTIRIYIGKCRDGRADQSFALWKDFERMQIKDKDTYKSPEEQLLETFSDIEPVEPTKPKPTISTEIFTGTETDQQAQEDGDFIDV